MRIQLLGEAWQLEGVEDPNSLWHIDYHKLIRWKFVTHGCSIMYATLC